MKCMRAERNVNLPKSVGTSRILAICMCSVCDGLMVMMFGSVPLRRLALPLHPVHLKTRTIAESVVKQMVIISVCAGGSVSLWQMPSIRAGRHRREGNGGRRGGMGRVWGNERIENVMRRQQHQFRESMRSHCPNM